MNAPRFLAHVQFQQLVSEYRALDRDIDRATARLHYYPTEQEEEAENEATDRELESLGRISYDLSARLAQIQRARLSGMGLGVKQ